MGNTYLGLDVGLHSTPTQQNFHLSEADKSGRFIRNLLLCMDFVLLVLGGILAWYIRFCTPDVPCMMCFGDIQPMARHASFLFLYIALFLLFASIRGLYVRPWKLQCLKEVVELGKAAASAGFVLMSAVYVSGERTISREVVCCAILFGTVLMCMCRILLRHLCVSAVNEKRNVVIVGAGPVGKALRQYLMENPRLRYNVHGFVDRRQVGRYVTPPDASEEEEFLGSVSDLGRIARANFIDEVLVTLPSDRTLVKDVVLQAQLAGVSVRVVPDLYDGLALGSPVEFVGQFPTIALRQEVIPAVQLIFKRVVDVIASAIALVLLAPIFGILAIVIKLDSDGPVFYNSTRVGKKGRTFICHKFRTMVADAEQQKKRLAHMNERDGVLFKISNDPRITRVGKILRKYSIDELPQFWNVLCAEMSLVGPRPPVPDEYTQYALDQLRRLEVVPGITGLWQVEARQSRAFADYIKLDIEYVENWSFWLDLKLMLRTVKVVLAGTGQ